MNPDPVLRRPPVYKQNRPAVDGRVHHHGAFQSRGHVAPRVPGRWSIYGALVARAIEADKFAPWAQARPRADGP
jgi:hypothetical protein